ncbi:methyl-accepting chemotaxis protein [Brachyspira innocens]|uniref:Methyl-accepting chemotaxis protein n=1 Tax=Brachyspira innocens TaxID=13264 RepID=A0ABT8Z2R8_9SPIR|nr:methyl-accepting chemotaxis protein [Brachyspira innocens]MDO6992539.1 methyl-accepting chemotaxis protein [Brachyspira innocens]MDO7021740.1 methyl-accepting chemotaxis protein [Brachyspira innocens]
MKNNRVLLLKLIIPFAVFLLVAYIIMYFAYKKVYTNEFIKNTLVEMDNTELVLSIEMEKVYDVMYTLRGYFEANDNTFTSIRKTLESILKSNKNIYDILYGNEIPYRDGGLFVNGISPYPDTYDQTSRLWYKGALTKNGIFITEPYVDANTGGICITLALAVYTNNSLKGVIGIDFLEMNNISKKVISDNQVNIMTSAGLYMSHQNKDYIFNDNYNVYQEPLFKDAKSLEDPNKAVMQIVGNEWYTIKPLRDTPYKIVIRGNMNAINNRIRNIMLAYLLVIIILISIQTALAFFVVIPISQMLDKAMNSIDQMSKGNFIIDSQDNENKNDKSGSLVSYVNNMKNTIGNVVLKLQSNLNTINNEIENISSSSEYLSDRSNTQAAAIEELTGSMQSLSSSIKEISSNSLQAKDKSSKIMDTTTTGVEAVNEISAHMHEISESSKKISEITKLIQSIAFQTNILALNAAVEAARAGEQGRGFAIVASEVRSLAQTVNEAANNITSIVEETVKRVEIGNESANKSSSILNTINDLVKEMENELQDISQSIMQEEDGISQMNIAIKELNNITQENSSLATQNSSSSLEISNMSKDIINEIEYFKLKK